MTKLFVHALYDDEKSAQAAVGALVDAHFAGDDISVLMSTGGGVEGVPVRLETGLPPGALIGAALGVSLGATGFGGLLAVGPLLVALQGATAGGLLGGFGGAIAGLGYWNTAAEFPEAHLHGGGALVGVSTYAARADAAREALARTGGRHIGSTEHSPETEARNELT